MADHFPHHEQDSAEMRIEDPQGDQAFNLPKEPDQIELLHMEEKRKLEEQRSPNLVRFRASLPDIGKFIIPTRNTYSAHKAIVQNESRGIGFSPRQYPIFDSLIANAFMVDAFSQEGHKLYDVYAPMRDNIAIVRNIIFSTMFADGAFNKEDPRDLAKQKFVSQIAREIGVGLQRDSKWKFPGTKSISNDLANTPDVGAIEIYNKLLELQNERTLYHPMAMLTGQPNYDWNLPPIEETPLYDIILGQFEPGGLGGGDIHVGTVGERLSNVATQLTYTASRLNDVETLPPPVLDEAIELAREILDKLKIKLSNEALDERLSHNPTAQLDNAMSAMQAAMIYSDYIKSLSILHPQMINDPMIQKTNRVIGKIGYLAQQHAVEQLTNEGDANTLGPLTNTMQKMPPEWFPDHNDNMASLIAELEAGMEYAAKAKEIPSQNAAHQQQHVRDVRPQTEAEIAQEMQQLSDRLNQLQQQKAGLQPPQADDKVNIQVKQSDLAMLKKMGITWGPEPRIMQTSHPEANRIGEQLHQQQAESRAPSQQPEHTLESPSLSHKS